MIPFFFSSFETEGLFLFSRSSFSSESEFRKFCFYLVATGGKNGIKLFFVYASQFKGMVIRPFYFPTNSFQLTGQFMSIISSNGFLLDVELSVGDGSPFSIGALGLKFLTEILWDNTRILVDTANGGTSQTYSSKNGRIGCL